MKQKKGPNENPLEHVPQALQEATIAIYQGILEALMCYILRVSERIDEKKLKSDSCATIPKETIKQLELILVFLEKNASESAALKKLLFSCFTRPGVFSKYAEEEQKKLISRFYHPEDESLKQEFTIPPPDGKFPFDMIDIIIQTVGLLPKKASEIQYKLFGTLISDTQIKNYVGSSYSLNYCQAMLPLLERNDAPHTTLTSISVQLFTLSVLSQYLSENKHLFENITKFGKIIKDRFGILRSRKPDKIVYPTSLITKDGFYHYIHDISYLLIHEPVAKNFLFGKEGEKPEVVKQILNSFLQDIILPFQGMVEVDNSDADSDTWHQPLVMDCRTLPQVVRLMSTGVDYFFSQVFPNSAASISGKETMVTKFGNVVDVFLTAFDKFFETERPNMGIKALFGEEYFSADEEIKFVNFSMKQGPFIFQLPLHRIFSLLMHKFLANFEKLKVCDPKLADTLNLPSILYQIAKGKQLLDKEFVLRMIEHPIRLMGIRAHTNCSLWPRDQYNVNTQAVNYDYFPWVDYTYSLDVNLLQSSFSFFLFFIFFAKNSKKKPISHLFNSKSWIHTFEKY